MNWKEYLNNTKNKLVSPLLKEAFNYINIKNNALDLGCGALSDTKNILKIGFKHIDAIDSNKSIVKLVEQIQDTNGRLTFYLLPFEEFDFPVNTYNIINAQHSLPFIKESCFETTWYNIQKSICNGGVFTGQFFGVKDAWATRTDMNFHTKKQIKSYFKTDTWQIHKFDEFLGIKKTVAGTDKKCHIFSIIATRINTDGD